LSSSFYLYRFHKYVSCGFPIINFCNPGVHYETPCILDLINAWKMEHIKMIKAQQAKATYTYKNTKERLLKTNTAIWFDKMCRSNQLTPKYINITINGNN
jgi:hypothetical protein